MKITTKRALVKLAAAAAVVATAAVIFTPASSFAAAGRASASVSVRAQPSTSAARLDTLYSGEVVDIVGCRSGWCYITHPGPDGYVSAQYLRRGTGGTVTVDPNFNLSFTVGNGLFSFGNSGISIGIGGGNTPPPSNTADVCFYSDVNYGGSAYCLNEGATRSSIPANWNDRISSIRNNSGARVTVCTDGGFYGDCRTYTTSARQLYDFNDEISSIRVR